MTIQRATAFVSILALTLATAAQAQPAGKTRDRVIPASALPSALRKSIAEDNAMCIDMGGKPGKPSKLVRFADLNGDGITDFIKDLAYYNCEGAASAMSAGQSGSAVTIFIGAPGGVAIEAYHAVVQGARLIGPPGKQRLYVGVMGPDCGQKNAARMAMVDVAVCQRPLNWKPEKKTFVLAPLSEKKPFSFE